MTKRHWLALLGLLGLFVILSSIVVAPDTSRGTPAATTLGGSPIVCDSPQRCEEIDRAWLRFSIKFADFVSRTRVWEPDSGWVEYASPEEEEATSSLPVSPTGAAAGACPYTQPASDSQAVGASDSGSLVNGVLLADSTYVNEVSSTAYGTQELVNILELAACAVGQRHNVILEVNDLSSRFGGSLSPHTSHQSGLDADVGYYHYENEKYWNDYRPVCTQTADRQSCTDPVPSFNNPQALEANWEFIKILQQLYDLDQIIVNDGIYRLLEQHVIRNHPREWEQYSRVLNNQELNHHDHMHIRIKCPQNDALCNQGVDRRASGPIRFNVLDQLSSPVPAAISGTAAAFPVEPREALTSCTQIFQNVILGEDNSPSVKDASTFWVPALTTQSLYGTSWIGKLSSNGPADSQSLLDTGRATLIFALCTTNFQNPVEVMYYFHGHEGFSQTDFSHVAQQVAQLSVDGRNFVLVFPELPWSAGTDATMRRGRDLENDFDLTQLHTNVLTILNSQFSSNINIAYVSLAAHSGGGKVLGKASGDVLNALRPKKITFADADYGAYAANVYRHYVESNPEVVLNLLVRDPNSQNGDHRPTCKAIQFMHDLDDQETANWSCNPGSILSSATPGAASNSAFTTAQHPNIRYVPLQKTHGQIGQIALTWSPS